MIISFSFGYIFKLSAISKGNLFSASESVLQINGKNFLYPNAPYLLKSRDVNPEIICNVGKESEHKEPQCLQVLKAEANEVIELVLANEGEFLIISIHNSNIKTQVKKLHFTCNIHSGWTGLCGN